MYIYYKQEITTKEYRQRIQQDGVTKTIYSNGIQVTQYPNGRVRIKDEKVNIKINIFE